tara:strand:+ start:1380 stop:1610 length:231 start_codon:yes stop_codon:yes gene_type:complete
MTPMDILRIERNKLLKETDHYGLSDVSMSEEMKTYRQQLRDLPSTASPKFADGVEIEKWGVFPVSLITNVTFPTKP